MKFDWDSDKSNRNKIKHGIDFVTAKEIWSDQKRVEIHAPHPLEERNIIIGKLDNKLWTAIYTIRNDTVRLISTRRSRKKEVKLYEK